MHAWPVRYGLSRHARRVPHLRGFMKPFKRVLYSTSAAPLAGKGAPQPAQVGGRLSDMGWGLAGQASCWDCWSCLTACSQIAVRAGAGPDRKLHQALLLICTWTPTAASEIMFCLAGQPLRSHHRLWPPRWSPGVSPHLSAGPGTGSASRFERRQELGCTCQEAVIAQSLFPRKGFVHPGRKVQLVAGAQQVGGKAC